MSEKETLENIITELRSVRKKIFDLAKKTGGPTAQIARLVGGSVVPLVDQAVLELGTQATITELRLQRLEAHTKIIDDDDLLEGLDAEPIEFITAVVVLAELAKQSPEAKQPEVETLITDTQRIALDWKDYLLEYTEEVPEETPADEPKEETKEESEES